MLRGLFFLLGFVSTMSRPPVCVYVCVLQMLLLVFMFAFTGLELAFWSGEFSQMLDQSVIGLVLCFAGVGEMAGSLLTNRLSDRVGCSWMLTVGAIVYACGLCLASYIHVWLARCGVELSGVEGSGVECGCVGFRLVAHTLSSSVESPFAHWPFWCCHPQVRPPGALPVWEKASWMAFVAAFSFGVGDSCLNTQVCGQAAQSKATRKAARTQLSKHTPPSWLLLTHTHTHTHAHTHTHTLSLSLSYYFFWGGGR